MKRQTLVILVFMMVPLTGLAQGRFSGVVFGDYFYNAARDTAFDRANLPVAALYGPRGMQGFVIRRINLVYDYDISSQFATRFRVEADGSGGPRGATTQDSKLAVFVKDAWLRWKGIFPGSDLFVGIQPTQHFEIAEAAWSYRSLEKTITDLRGILSTRGLGVGLRGKIDHAGVFNYWAMVTNQSPGIVPKDISAGLTNGDKYNLYSLLLYLHPTREIQFTVYGDYRPTYPVNDPASATVPPGTVSNATYTGAVFAGYVVPESFGVGAEGVTQMSSNAYRDPGNATALKTRKRLGVSVWAWASLDSSLALVGRYDYFDPMTGSAIAEKGDSRNFFLAGVAYRPAKGVQIIPNIEAETFQAIPNGRSVDASVTGRLTFAYTF